MKWIKGLTMNIYKDQEYEVDKGLTLSIYKDQGHEVDKRPYTGHLQGPGT